MKKNIFLVLIITMIISVFGCLSSNPKLKGFYQSEVNGYHVQILIQKKDSRFIEWIDNREVDRGTYKKDDNNFYSMNSGKQNFKIELNDDNSFEIIIKKLNNGNPIIMKNINVEDTTISFGEWDDVDEYESLLE